MTFRLVDEGWGQVFREAAAADASALGIICPFIKKGAPQHLLDGRAPDAIQVIVRFNLSNFADGVSDIDALDLLLARGAAVRGVRHLHAKPYHFGDGRAILTSANLTQAALFGNHELGFVAAEPNITEQCRAYFDAMWRRAGADLTLERLRSWERAVTRYHAEGGRPGGKTRLGDEGVEIGLPRFPWSWEEARPISPRRSSSSSESRAIASPCHGRPSARSSAPAATGRSPTPRRSDPPASWTVL